MMPAPMAPPVAPRLARATPNTGALTSTAPTGPGLSDEAVLRGGTSGMQGGAPAINPNQPLLDQQRALTEYIAGSGEVGDLETNAREQSRIGGIMRGMGNKQRMDWASQASRAMSGIGSGYAEKQARETRGTMQKKGGELAAEYLRKMGYGPKQDDNAGSNYE
jgi:hypothetical protein